MFIFIVHPGLKKEAIDCFYFDIFRLLLHFSLLSELLGGLVGHVGVIDHPPSSCGDGDGDGGDDDLPESPD